MRVWLCVCAALALCGAARAPDSPRPGLGRIRRQILAKLGLSARPSPQRAPPRDVVRQILAHAGQDPPPPSHDDHNTREIIAIAHRDFSTPRSYECIVVPPPNAPRVL